MPILGTIASSYLSAVPNSYESIATYTIADTTTKYITFSSIPQTYKHLQIRIMARSRRAITLESGAITYAGDFSGNYVTHILQGTGGGSASSSSAPNDYVTMLLTGANATANVFAPTICDIYDYTSTAKYKVHKALSGVKFTSYGYIRFGGEIYYGSTSAISSITLSDGGGNTAFEIGTHAALYGIKG